MLPWNIQDSKTRTVKEGNTALKPLMTLTSMGGRALNNLCGKAHEGVVCLANLYSTWESMNLERLRNVALDLGM